jgi:TatD DNase family protein
VADKDQRPVELPDLGVSIADTHAHLDMLDDPSGALERAAMSRVSYIVTIVDATEAPEGTFQHLRDWQAEATRRLADWEVGTQAPEVRIVLGTHPHNAKDYTEEIEALTAEWASDPRVAGVGEIGLDYHYDHSPRGDQRRAFRSQLQLAKRLGLPAVVHLRDAHDEGYAILEEEGLPDAGCVVHCFTDGPELAKRFLDLGCHISFAGPVTFGKADQIREAARLVPLDRLLVETDCPFMAPAPYRGRTNEPAWAVLNAVRIAEVKGMGATELAASLYSNAKRLFGGVA